MESFFRWMAVGLLWASLVTGASAAPPSSCAARFIGTWVYPGGSTVVAAGGLAYPKCPLCVPTQTWTCQGNTYLFSNSGAPGQFSATLSPDGRQLIGGGTVATRVGGAARVDSPEKKAAEKKAAAEKKEANAAPKAAAAPSRPSSCSDITGTGGAASVQTHCRDADKSLYAARLIKQSNPQASAVEYKKAAASARQAGDNKLELEILREAAEAAAVVVAPVASNATGASGALPTAPGSGSGRMRPLWDGTRENCRSASELEKATAGWFDMCSDPAPAVGKQAYRPFPDPMQLSKSAREACGSYSRDTQACFGDFKLKAILAANPNWREVCEKRAADASPLRRQLAARLGVSLDREREAFRECVDNLYLYGDFDGPPSPRVSLREQLKARLKDKDGGTSATVAADDAALGRRACWAPDRCCQAGYGLKPTPGAFGAWSCQPLGLLSLDSTRPRLPPQEESDLADDFEARVNEAVAKAVAAALRDSEATLSDRQKEICTAAAFAALHASVKSGSVDLTAECAGVAQTARSYFQAYASGHLDTGNSAFEDILASFDLNLGAPLPGMVGLKPSDQFRSLDPNSR